MKNQKSKAAAIIVSLILSVTLFICTFTVFRPYYYENLYIAPTPTNLSKASASQGELVFADFYISTDGSDGASGTVDHPFATIKRAQEAMRMLNKSLRSHVVIAIKAGTYDIDSFKLTKKDSGTEKCPIIYTAYGDGEVILCGKSSEFAIEIISAKYVTLSNITVENPTGNGIKIDSSNVDISGCSLRNIAGTGIIAQGKNININGCHISKTGLSAAETNGNNISFDNNLIHSNSMAEKTIPAIIINGNKNSITHNEIYNTPSCAVYYSGNKNSIEYNYIHNALLEVDSTAAISGNPDSLDEENLVRYNCISTIGSGKNSPTGIIPSPGTTVRGNMLINIKGSAVCVLNPKGVEISNNISVNCAVPVKAENNSDAKIESNIILHHSGNINNFPENNLVFKLNETDIFLDAENGVYDIHKDNSSIMSIGFKNLPFDSMGRY